MRIENIRTSTSSGTQSLCATIVWEDRPADPFEMRFSIPEHPALRLEPLADPFVLAAYTRAFDNGEKRLACEYPVGEGLAAAMSSALAILIHWNREKFGGRPLTALELKSREAPLAGQRDIAAFYSGGVDSTHLLLRNALENAPGTAGRIRHAVAVYGLDMGKSASAAQETVFAQFLASAEPFLSGIGLVATPLHTNLRHLDPSLRHFGELGAGFDLAACAMVFAPHARGFMIANPGEPLSRTVQTPQSVHPIIHQCLCSGDMHVRTPYIEVARTERIREIGESEEAMRALRVCFFSEDRALNCGRCEKCVRTMLAMHVNDLPVRQTFPTELTPALVRGAYITTAPVAQMHADLLRRLEARGDRALASAERRILRSWALRDALSRLRRAALRSFTGTPGERR